MKRSEQANEAKLGPKIRAVTDLSHELTEIVPLLCGMKMPH